MRKILALIVSSYCIIFAFATSTKAQESGNIQISADSALKLSTWDIQKQFDGTMMFLDIPFSFRDSKVFVTVTVAKQPGKERPNFISFIVPSIADTSQGLYLSFANDTMKDGKRDLNINKDQLVRLPFENTNSEFCTAKLKDAIAITKEKKTKIDVFQNLLTYDYLLVLFYTIEGHKTVVAPLVMFKKQYKTLE